jgi:CDP-paratose 2-epimerase
MTVGRSSFVVAPRLPPRPLLGTAERFRPGEPERVERVLEGVRQLGIEALRVPVSWEDHQQSDGQEWYDWLLGRLAREVDILPCVVHPAAMASARAHAPRPHAVTAHGLNSYADFLDLLATRHGRHFAWIELWSEPAGRHDWDRYLDSDWTAACEVIAAAARRIRQRGKKVVFSGFCPTGLDWLRLSCERGILDHCDAIGLCDDARDGSRPHRTDWTRVAGAVRGVLDRFGLDPELWITEAGYPTWPYEDMGQADALLAALDAPVQRVYWCRYQDTAQRDPADAPMPPLCNGDDRPGLMTADGKPKLLSRLLMRDGIDGVRTLRRRVTVPEELRTPRVARIGFGRKRTVIVGGAGFVGVNLADRLAETGHQVLIFDNLSRPGVEDNLNWLLHRHRGRVAAEVADVRDAQAAYEAVKQADRLFHFAAQVAVTTALRAPVEDFEVNARGTLNLLEGMRASADPPGLVYTSTNKVYGALADIALEERQRRYAPTDPVVAARGISEDRPLDFHSPYGCSKGAADQYVLDYARTYGLPATVFRMSCIYGPHQCGTEDQGWVAHFLIKALEGGEITIYGNGKQVRDILFVDDLVEALLLAQSHMPRIRGQAFNIGGGPRNTTSLIELLDLIRRISPAQPSVAYGSARPGDQLYYVSDTRRFGDATGWRPTVTVEAGVTRLLAWLGGARADRAAMPQYERSAS